MKLYEILSEEQLDEKSLKHALAAGILGTSMAMSSPTSDDKPPAYERPTDEIAVTAKRQGDAFKPEINISAPTWAKRMELTKSIASKYRVDQDLVMRVVNLAYEYEDQTFPKAKDILAIIGVESSFNPKSKSNLRTDPAVGLMQVRPGVWNIDPEHLDNVEMQIKYGVDILRHYYKKLGNAEDAVQAYNLGITRFRRGGRNTRYVAKYQQELAHND